jgi:methylation protein EvaC
MSGASTACRICGAPIEPFMTFGRMPIANGFIREEDIATEFFYELAPACCGRCATFQLIDQPPPPQLFHAQYPFYTGSSQRMARHFASFASGVVARAGLQRDPLVVEIGSNDGTMLDSIRQCGARAVGVEPSANVAAAARARGLDTVPAFFSRAVAAAIRERSGAAAAIVAANVVCHIPDFHELAAAVCDLLAEDGWFVFEDPYLGDMIRHHAYDQIYDEHVFMWSATAVSRALAPHRLSLVDVAPQPTHGGSMRYICARTGRAAISPRVMELLEREERDGLASPSTLQAFRDACETSRRELRALLTELRERGKRVAGYAAASKSTTVLNYCGIDRTLIEFIADSTPIKQGRLTPGSHIPVLAPEVFAADPPDYAVLFAWNHAQEIVAKEQTFTRGGGKWITFVPSLAVMD